MNYLTKIKISNNHFLDKPQRPKTPKEMTKILELETDVLKTSAKKPFAQVICRSCKMTNTTQMQKKIATLALIPSSPAGHLEV